MRKKYRMTEEQFAKLMTACTPVPLLALQCGMPPDPQEQANNAWQTLAKELGFIWDTVRPDGSDNRNFTAEPTDA